MIKEHKCEMFPEEAAWNAFDEAIERGQQPAWAATNIHLEQQDTSLPGWNALLQLIEDVARSHQETFSPKKALGAALWGQVITLPASIAKLKNVKKLDLYGSDLIRIPSEIGEMEALQEFIPYTSYGLHWFPYEITRCRHLKSSTVSTRALYGNCKYRLPFPSLATTVVELTTERCSICNNQIDPSQVLQRWISLPIATDVLPLLVNACSRVCIDKLPHPPEGYIRFPHEGGPGQWQPLPD